MIHQDDTVTAGLIAASARLTWTGSEERRESRPLLISSVPDTSNLETFHQHPSPHPDCDGWCPGHNDSASFVNFSFSISIPSSERKSFTAARPGSTHLYSEVFIYPG